MNKLKICFITRQLDGLDNNGGIGTATRYIAEHLAQDGCDIDVFHTGEKPSPSDFLSLQKILSAQDINLFGIHDDAAVYHEPEQRPYQVYTVLKQTDYDVYLFHDWKADGFFCFLARQSGVAFQDARLGLVLHSSSEWCAEGNKELFPMVEEYQRWEMEQACCKMADFAVSPSQYLFDWCAQADWVLPEKSVVIPNLVFPPDWVRTEPQKFVEAAHVHLAFFGRLEERKGIKVFIDAIRLLPPSMLEQMELSFLGSESGYTEQLIREELSGQLPYLRGVHIETQLGSIEARAYLQKHGCIAIMPSHTDNSPCVIYECLELGIPFLISDQGGGKELVAETDRAQCCFSPNKKACAAAMVRLIESGGRPATPSYSIASVVGQWGTLFADLGADLKSVAPSMNTAQPLVSIVLIHHERPDLLKLTLNALQEQTYPNYEIVLVDDGSQSKLARRALAEIEQADHAHPVRVIHQENRYLGAARNHGVREAAGDYIVFFDDDNIALPHMLETQMKTMLHSGADVVTSAMRDLPRKDGLPALEHDADNVVYTFWGGCTGLSGMVINHFGDAVGLYKKEMLLRTNGFHEQHGVTYEDWRMHVEIQALGGNIVAIPDVLFWYRTNPENMLQTTNPYDNIQQILEAYGNQLPHQLRKLPHWLLGYRSHAFVDHDEIKDSHAISVLDALTRVADPYAFFGAGKHTLRLFERMLQNDVPLPSVVFDDRPPCEEMYGVPVVKPDAEDSGFGPLVLSTDTYATPMGERCREIWGNDVPLIDLYKHLKY